MASVRLKLNFIKCDGCVATIQTALMHYSGVDRVNVDKLSGVVEIQAHQDIPMEEIKNKLADLGYPERKEETQYHKLGSQLKTYVSNELNRFMEEEI